MHPFLCDMGAYFAFTSLDNFLPPRSTLSQWNSSGPISHPNADGNPSTMNRKANAASLESIMLSTTNNGENSEYAASTKSDPLKGSDMIVRAQSPQGRRYLRPVNGIQVKGFARSAKRRSSVVTLGSIERLQHFYSKKELKVNKTGTLGFQENTFVEEVEDSENNFPNSDDEERRPAWVDIDVETNLDNLLEICAANIRSALATWSEAITTVSATTVGTDKALTTASAPHLSSATSIAASSNEDSGILALRKSLSKFPLVESVMKMIDSVKAYTVNRHDLTENALCRIRAASLTILQVMKDFEYQHDTSNINRRDCPTLSEACIQKYIEIQGNDNISTETFPHPTALDNERQAIVQYVQSVELYAINPPHHIGSPSITFTKDLASLMHDFQTPDFRDKHSKVAAYTVVSADPQPSVPLWIMRSSYVNDHMGRYCELLRDNVDDTLATAIIDPKESKRAFLESLANGIVLCYAFNNLVKRSRKPFGLITKVHTDSTRTYQAVENQRFFVAACKQRFEIDIMDFNATEVAKRSENGIAMLDRMLSAFCDTVIREIRSNLEV